MGEAITMPEQTDTLPTVFDYTTWDRAVADEGRSIAERVRQRTRAFVIDTGRDLVAIKGKLEHGQFTAWVQTALGITPRTAQNYMAAAEAFGAKSEIVSHLPPATIYKLAAAPEPVRTSVTKRMEAGETVRPDAILEAVKAARDEDRARRAEEKETARRDRLTPEERDEEDERTKRSAKGKVARERKAEAERDVWQVERERRKAAVRGAAAALLDALGPEATAHFADRHQAVGGEVVALAGDMAQAERARSQPVVDLSPDRFEAAPLWLYHSTEDQQAVRALAEEIGRDGLREPLLVEASREMRGRYRILDGRRRHQALTTILSVETIPVRIAPPIIADTVEKAA